MSPPADVVAWHDLECGGYTEDLPLWLELAGETGGPVLEIGAGTGRVSLELARQGHEVTALDHDPNLLAALDARRDDLPLETACADARRFGLPRRYALCLAPMQTLQLLGGAKGRSSFLGCVRAHLRPGGRLAAAVVTELDEFELRPGEPAPLPDVVEHDGVLLWSQPTAVRMADSHFTLERRREVVGADGRRTVTEDRIRLDRIDRDELEAEAARAGLRLHGWRVVPGTPDYAPSEVVILSA